MPKEANITISGIALSDAQSMAVRCAVADMLISLSDEEFRRDLGGIAEGYQARLSEVQELIFKSAQ